MSVSYEVTATALHAHFYMIITISERVESTMLKDAIIPPH